MKIDDNGTVRDMTPEEEAAYLAELTALEGMAEETTPQSAQGADSFSGKGSQDVGEASV